MVGLRKGNVELCEYSDEWVTEANTIIHTLKEILGDYAIDIQHIGSTSIFNIKAKPIIDIAIGVDSFSDLDNYIESLMRIGIYKSSGQPCEGIILFSKDDNNDNRCFNMQVVVYGEDKWNKHILFRDYLNANFDKAREYEKIKVEAAELFPNDVLSYSTYKSVFVNTIIQEAMNKIM